MWPPDFTSAIRHDWSDEYLWSADFKSPTTGPLKDALSSGNVYILSLDSIDEELDLSCGAQLYKIARPVEPFARAAERVRHKALAGQIRPAGIAERQTVAAEAQLAAHSEQPAKSLSYGQRRALEIGVALAVGPTIIGHGSMNYAVKYISPTIPATLILSEAVIAAGQPVEDRAALAWPSLKLVYCWTTATAALYLP